MMQATMIVTDWQPQVGRTPTPEQLRDIFQKELLDFGPALFLADRAGAIHLRAPLIAHAFGDSLPSRHLSSRVPRCAMPPVSSSSELLPQRAWPCRQRPPWLPNNC